MSYSITDIHLDKTEYIYGADTHMKLSFVLESTVSQTIDDIYIRYHGSFFTEDGREKDTIVLEEYALGAVSVIAGIPSYQTVDLRIQRPDLIGETCGFQSALEIVYAKYPLIRGTEEIVPHIKLDCDTFMIEATQKSQGHVTSSTPIHSGQRAFYTLEVNKKFGKNMSEILRYKEDIVRESIYQDMKSSSIVFRSLFFISQYCIEPAMRRKWDGIHFLIFFLFLELSVILAGKMIFDVFDVGTSFGATISMLCIYSISIFVVMIPITGIRRLRGLHQVHTKIFQESHEMRLRSPHFEDYIDSISVESFGESIHYTCRVYYELFVNTWKTGNKGSVYSITETLYSLPFIEKDGDGLFSFEGYQVQDGFGNFLEKLFVQPISSGRSGIGYQFRIQFSSPDVPDFEEVIQLS